MKIFEITKMGDFHINHNEDFYVITELSEEVLLIEVMDGCSMGTESHFASTLIGKILRKISQEISYRGFIEKEHPSLNCYLKKVLKKLFFELKELQSNLMLDNREILSTLSIGVINQNRKEAELLVIGDGLICSNKVLYEYNQENKPDYLGYHLNKNFEDWFKSQNQFLSLNNINDLSISTDGIYSFKKFDDKNYEPLNEIDLINLLLTDEKWIDQSNMLGKKLIEIENKFGLKPSDDLTIIRLIF